MEEVEASCGLLTDGSGCYECKPFRIGSVEQEVGLEIKFGSNLGMESSQKAQIKILYTNKIWMYLESDIWSSGLRELCMQLLENTARSARPSTWC